MRFINNVLGIQKPNVDNNVQVQPYLQVVFIRKYVVFEPYLKGTVSQDFRLHFLSVKTLIGGHLLTG